MKSVQIYALFLMLFLSYGVIAQTTVSGTITEEATGTPLPGVNVLVKGTTIGVTTDFDGNYQITTENGNTLVFSYIGFLTKEVIVTSENLDISLEEDLEQLDEVVVIGYGTTTKKDATGSVTAVSEKDFNKGAIVSADQLLNGKVAGVRITSNGGEPDAAPNIRIRGGSSLSAQNSPLIVIDGIPIDNTNPAGVSNPLSLINPNDIESFSILKDASSTAIYGSRASNGVIIITTKKGTSGAAKFNFSSNVSVGQVNNKIDLMSGEQFTRFIQEYHPTYTDILGIDDPNTNAVDNPNTDAVEGRILSDTDWQDQIYRTSISYNNNFSARANLFDRVPIRFSLGHTKNEGVVKTNDYERYTMSVKLTPSLLDDHLKIDFNAKGVHSDKNAIDDGGALGGAVNMDPTKPVFDNSPNNRFGGFYQSTIEDGNNLRLDGQQNPLAVLKQRSRPEKVDRILGNIQFDYKTHFLPELRAVLNLGLEASRAKIKESYSDNSLATYRFDDSNNDINTNYVFNPGLNYLDNQHITNTTMDAYLVYAKEYNGFLNKFDIQGGYAYQNFKNDGNKEEYRYNNITGLRELSPNEQNPNRRYYDVLNLQSFFGRTNLNFADKYLLTLSLRADASSLFLKENRWGYFPSAALAWKLKSEGFLENVNLVNDLKLRIGWGQTGQQDITSKVGFYPSTPLISSGSGTSQYLPGIGLYSADPFNEELTWEKTTTYNIGLDFDLFNNNLVSGSFDIYKKETTDLLADAPIAPGQGLTDSFVKNIGNTSSQGFELNLNLNLIQTEDYNLEVYSNLAYTRTEVTSLEDVSRFLADDSGLPTGTGVNLAFHAVGYQPFSAWVFKQLYDTNGNPVFGAFADLNNDNIIDNDDRFYETLRPNWTAGFGLNFNYKKWDFSTSFRGQIGGQVYNSRKLTSGWVDRPIPANSNSLGNVLDFYSGAADLNFTNINGNVPFSDYYLEDASFLRCENIVVGHRIDNFYESLVLRIYASVNNPFIITKYDGQDPENFNSIDNNFYPRPRIYTVGLSLDF